MAIARTQAVSANATSVAITSTTLGDLIVVFAYSTSTTIPTVPSGFYSITATAGTQQACACGWKVSPGGETTSGTWTNAASVVCMVYSGASVVGNNSGLQAGSSTSINYFGVTVQDTNSVVVGFAGAKSATTGMASNPTSGASQFTRRTNQTTVQGCDTAIPIGGNYNAQNLTISPTSRWFSFCVEIKPKPAGPYFVAAGAAVTGTTTANAGSPVNVLANDILLCVCQSSNQTITGAVGQTQIDDQTRMGTGTAATAGSVRLAVFWSRMASNYDTGFFFGTPPGGTTDHIIAQTLLFRGCRTNGNPWSDVATGFDSTAQTSGGFLTTGTPSMWLNGSSITPTSSFSSTANNSLIVWIVANAFDNATAQGAANYGTSLANRIECADSNTATGTGGGFSVFSGEMAAPGSIAVAGGFSPLATFFGGGANSSKAGFMWLALTSTAAMPVLPVDEGFYALSGGTVGLLWGQRAVALPAGSYSLTGQDVALPRGKKMPLAQGNYTYTGQTTGVNWNQRVIGIPSGSFSLTGQALNTLFGHRLIVDSSGTPTSPTSNILVSYTPGSDRNDFTGEVGVRLGIGGSDITINFIGARRHHANQTGTHTVRLYEWFTDTVQRTAVIDYTGVAVGDYAWTSVATVTMLATGYYALLMEVTAFDGQTWCNPGAAAFSGVTNVYDSYRVPASALTAGTPNNMFIGLDLGFATGGPTYSLTGQPVTLTKSAVAAILAAAQGAYVLTGQTLNFTRTSIMPLVQGAYALTGQAVPFLKGRTIALAQGAYALTGQLTNLLRKRTATLVQGAYALTGFVQNLIRSRKVPLVQGAYTLNGQALNLLRSRNVPLTFVAYTLTGQPVSLLKTTVGAFTMPVVQGAYLITGQAANLLRTRKIVLPQGAYSYSGQPVNFKAGKGMIAVQGLYTLSGQLVSFSTAHKMPFAPGNFALTGKPVVFARPRILPISNGVYLLTGHDLILISSAQETWVHYANQVTGSALIATAATSGLMVFEAGSAFISVITEEPGPILTGLTVWLDASQLALADGAAVSPWSDLSGNANHGIIVGSPAPTVRTNALNGKRVVRFKVNEGRVRGDTDLALSGLPAPGYNFSIFYIGRMVGPNVGRIFAGRYPEVNFLVGFHTSSTDIAYDAAFIGAVGGYPGGLPTPWKSYGYTGSHTGVAYATSFYINGSLIGGLTSGGGLQSGYNLSGYSATGTEETCDCEVSELLIYNHKLPDADRIANQNYLNTKWGLGLMARDAPIIGRAITGSDLAILVAKSELRAEKSEVDHG